MQGTDEWLKLRAGKFTGSRFKDLMARTRSGPAASRRNLIITLAVERITGQCAPTYSNAAMQRGTELEPYARDAYSDREMVFVDQVDFIEHPELDYVGVSPDGLVGDDGMVEIKCPSAPAKHYDALIKAGHVAEYWWQLQGQLWVAGRQWVDAVSYHPDWPDHLQLARTRVERDAKAIGDLAEACVTGNDEVIEAVEKLERINGQNH